MKLSILGILIASALLLASLEAGRGSLGKSTSGSSHGRSSHSSNVSTRLSSRGSGSRKSTEKTLRYGVGSKRNSGTTSNHPQFPAKNKTPDKSSIALALGNYLSNKKVDKTGPRTICKRSTGECTNTENTDSKTKNALRSFLENKNKVQVSRPELKSNKKTETDKSSVALALRNFLSNKKVDKSQSFRFSNKKCKRSTGAGDCELSGSKQTPSTAGGNKQTPIAGGNKLTPTAEKKKENKKIGTVNKHENDAGPDKIFLKNGNSKFGLQHILEGHQGDFKRMFDLQGSNEEEINAMIKDIVLKAAGIQSVKNTQQIKTNEKTGLKTISSQKEVEYNNKKRTIVIAIGEYGSIITSYPIKTKVKKEGKIA